MTPILFLMENPERAKNVFKKVKNIEKQYHPTESEDINNPMIWKPEHWKWYLKKNKINLESIEKYLSASTDLLKMYNNIDTTLIFVDNSYIKKRKETLKKDINFCKAYIKVFK